MASRTARAGRSRGSGDLHRPARAQGVPRRGHGACARADGASRLRPRSYGPYPPGSGAPAASTQPLGPGFTGRAATVSWDKWRFHVRVEPRRGAVISEVQDRRRHDASARCSIRARFSEIFVPYMDPASRGTTGRTSMTASSATRSASRASRCSAGSTARPTRRTSTSVDGRRTRRPAPAAGRRVPVRARQRRRCSGASRRRRSSTAAARATWCCASIATVGNYDYVFDWVFQQDGSIRGAVGATGIVGEGRRQPHRDRRCERARRRVRPLRAPRTRSP